MANAHSYGLPNGYREKAGLALGLLGVALAWVLHIVLNSFSLSVPWWVDAPSVVGFFGLAYGLFDRWAWRIPVFRRRVLGNMPDLAGRWTGSVKSSFDGFEVDHPVEATIVQTWSRLNVLIRADHSASESMSAAFDIGDDGIWGVVYTFRNEPLIGAPEAMNAHRGTATLRLEGDVLIGDYYSGRGRQNLGSIKLGSH